MATILSGIPMRKQKWIVFKNVNFENVTRIGVSNVILIGFLPKYELHKRVPLDI